MKLPTLPKNNGAEWPIDWQVATLLVEAMVEWASRPWRKGMWYHHLGPALSHSGLSLKWMLAGAEGRPATVSWEVPHFVLNERPGFGWGKYQQDRMVKVMEDCGLVVGSSWNGNGSAQVSFHVLLDVDNSWKLNWEYAKYIDLYGLKGWPESLHKLMAPSPEKPVQLEESIDLAKAVHLLDEIAKLEQEAERLRTRTVSTAEEIIEKKILVVACEEARTAKEVNDLLYGRVKPEIKGERFTL